MRLVDISNLVVSFPQDDGIVQAVRGVSLHLDPGESLGIVGESGSGKSVTCMAALRLLREPPAKISADRLDIGGVSMLQADKRQLTAVRAGQSQQITVGNLRRTQKPGGIHAFGVEQADVVGPEHMAWQAAQRRHQLGRCGWRAR